MSSDSPIDWASVTRSATEAVSIASIEAACRALDYLCAAQLYLSDVPLPHRDLTTQDLKKPSGHWGVCPPVNLVLAHVTSIAHHAPAPAEVLVVHGAGHAGPSSLAHGYLTGRLGKTHPEFTHSRLGLRNLVGGFPHLDSLGSEITPLLPGHLYMGGQLGAALAFAHGAALDAPHRLVLPLIGDGECETGATAGAWLAARALGGTGVHGTVVPVILLNGQRMGGPSLLAALSQHELIEYFTSLGYRPYFTDADQRNFRAALLAALCGAGPLQNGPTSLLICTADKGFGAPNQVNGRAIAGTPAVHKTPLSDPRHDRNELEALNAWLGSYHPGDLIDGDGRPTPLVSAALPEAVRLASSTAVPAPHKCVGTCSAIAASIGPGDFGALISEVLEQLAAAGALRVFSPDELSSNRIALSPATTASAVIEVLNEEICHAWAQGYLETGRQALVITYEAFAPVAVSLLVQHLKYRRLARRAERPAARSIVYLLTSLGWNNSYTHQNPGMVSALLATEDPSLRIHTPADAPRAAASLMFALRKLDRCTIVTAGKHPTPRYPIEPFAEELRYGIAIWPHASDLGEPDIIFAAAGDIASRELIAAAELLRGRLPGIRIRFVAIHDLTALGDPGIWPMGLSPRHFEAIFEGDCPVLVAVPFLRDGAKSLLWKRPDTQRFHIAGYSDPGRPLAPDTLLRHCGLDAHSLTETSIHLLSGTNFAERS